MSRVYNFSALVQLFYQRKYSKKQQMKCLDYQGSGHVGNGNEPSVPKCFMTTLSKKQRQDIRDLNEYS